MNINVLDKQRPEPGPGCQNGPRPNIRTKDIGWLPNSFFDFSLSIHLILYTKKRLIYNTKVQIKITVKNDLFGFFPSGPVPWFGPQL